MKIRLQKKSVRTVSLALALMLSAGTLLNMGAVYSAGTVKNLPKAKASVSAASVITPIALKDEVRAVWITYFEMEAMLKNKSESAFRENAKAMFKTLSKDQMNTVYVQVRPFSDALYSSKIYPSSYMMTGVEGDQMAYDPLKIMIEEAKRENLKIEAWINPYRVRLNSIKAPISEANPATAWLTDGSNRVVKLPGGVFYNPSDVQVNALVVKGVKEIVDNYKVDGIHFDDYFYPTQSKDFDKLQYDAYVKAGGKLNLYDFRREQINQMVQSVYKVCKTAKNPVKFGISPQGLVKNNFDQQYADVKKWTSQPGYVDYICPQIYYGFKNTKAPFMTILKEWDDMTKTSKVPLYIGLASYKIGVEDKWSGEGKKEWQTDSAILSHMVAESRLLSSYKGFALFRYDSMWKPSASVKAQVNSEKESLIRLCMDK